LGISRTGLDGGSTLLHPANPVTDALSDASATLAARVMLSEGLHPRTSMEIVALLITGIILSSALWLPVRFGTTRTAKDSGVAARKKEIQVFSMKELQKDIDVLSKS
jgi:hypothetical protein